MNIADVGNKRGPDYKYIRAMNKKAQFNTMLEVESNLLLI
jgi:hypothetical protein